MYDRAARLLTCTSSSTSPHVGPGTYNFHTNTRGTGENYAPFHSMDVRESFLTIGETVAAAPGPGHYSAVISKDKVKGGTSVNDKSIRFHPVKSVTPGPGSYSISSKWKEENRPVDQGLLRKSRSINRMKHQQQATAPSIPAFGQNYGYEEDNDGRLKPQDCPNYDRTMGPAFYYVPSEDTATSRKYKGVHFGHLTSDRTVFKECHRGPGPGAYTPMEKELKSTVATSMKQTKQSIIPRYHEYIPKLERAKGVPGPGQYDIKSQFELEVYEDDTNSSIVPFGSTMQRFGSNKTDSPACNSYQDPRTAFDSVQRVTGMRKTPFCQTSKRFKTNRETAHLPGPGAYDDCRNTSMAAEAMKKTVVNASSNCPFGSTASRVLPLTKRDDYIMPSPAAYQDIDSPKTTMTYNKPSHTFASTSKRIPDIVKDTPSPATYQITESYSKPQGKINSNAGHVGFLSQVDRFAVPDMFLEEAGRQYPGPGEYNNVTIPQQKHHSGLLCSKDDRFKSSNSKTPGPGTYSMPKAVAQTVLKGTFNAGLNNPLKNIKKSRTTPGIKQN